MGARLRGVVTPGHRTYQVEEWGVVDAPVTDLLAGGRLDVHPSVIDSGYFTVRSRRGRLVLQAGGFIGAIPLNDRVAIEVTPRVPLRNLARILRLAGHAPSAIEDTARRYEREPGMHPSLLDLYARALAAHVGDIRLRGLLREYTPRHEVTSFPRGRILLNETVESLRPRGVSHRLPVEWHQRTTDNPCNRCIKYVVWFLARHRSDIVQGQATSQGRVVREALNRSWRVFDSVAFDRSRAFLRAPVVTGVRPLPPVRAYYRPVLDLCLAVIRQQGVSLDRDTGDLGLPSLVVDMSAAFEAYVRAVLTRHAAQDGWGVAVLDGNHRPPGGAAKGLFHDGDDVRATPDIVLTRGTGDDRAYPLLLEVKYKPADRGLSREDLNQAVAYGVSYRCADVVLVQPRGATVDDAAIGLRRLGTIDATTYHRYTYDLGADDLVGQEQRFVSAITSLLGEAGADRRSSFRQFR